MKTLGEVTIQPKGCEAISTVISKVQKENYMSMLYLLSLVKIETQLITSIIRLEKKLFQKNRNEKYCDTNLMKLKGKDLN